MPSFLEIQFPSDISYGVTGGMQFKTDIAQVENGQEVRNVTWALPKGKWNAQAGIRNATDYAKLLAFFNVVQGRAYGFRWKDWSDYQVTDQALRQTGAATVQLEKSYTFSGQTFWRTITKPIASPAVTFKRNGVSASATVDTTTGLVTLTASSSASILVILKNSTGNVVTNGAHGFSTGDKIWISGCGGMTQVNDKLYTITKVDNTEFKLNVNTTNYTTYTSGGTASKYPQPADTLTWSGQFDVPARFDTDDMGLEVVAPDAGQWPSVPIVGLR